MSNKGGVEKPVFVNVIWLKWDIVGWFMLMGNFRVRSMLSCYFSNEYYSYKRNSFVTFTMYHEIQLVYDKVLFHLIFWNCGDADAITNPY